MEKQKVTRSDQLKLKCNFESTTGKLFLVRCAACDKENYSIGVSSGQCSFCGWKEE